MIDIVLTPGRTLALVCIALPVLFAILSTVGGNLEEGLRAQPPTEVEETDCRIEAMMSGDNPVEVETIHRACVQAANACSSSRMRASPRRSPSGFDPAWPEFSRHAPETRTDLVRREQWMSGSREAGDDEDAEGRRRARAGWTLCLWMPAGGRSRRRRWREDRAGL